MSSAATKNVARILPIPATILDVEFHCSTSMNVSSQNKPADPTPRGALASTLLQCSPDCVKLLDANGRVAFFNESGLGIMEIDDFEAVRGLYWPDLWPNESRPLLERAIAQARAGSTGSFVAPCPTAKGTPKWWDVTVTAIPDSAESERFVVVSRDITAQRNADAAERDASQRLRSIIGGSRDVLWDIDLATGKVWWSEGMHSVFGYAADQIGETTTWYHEHIHPDDRKRIVASMNDAVAHGDVVWDGQFRYRRADGSYIDVLDRGSIIRDAEGKALRFVGIMQDISVLTESANRNELLAKELAHRVNNTLAVVSGIFQQTKKTSKDLDGFSDNFGKRILAMANANSLLVRGGKSGADLDELARLQLAPFMGAGRVEIAGPKVALPFVMTQPLALALNELATNAIKYGALSVPEGQVSLTWSISPAQPSDVLTLTWHERNGPAVSEPQKSGFGTRLIERGIPGAAVKRSFDATGFKCEIDVALVA